MPEADEKKTRKPLRRRWFRVIFTAFLIVLLFGISAPLWAPPLLQRYAMSFRVNDPQKSDAICILLGDFRVRPLRAAELYLRGYAPQVLIADFP